MATVNEDERPKVPKKDILGDLEKSRHQRRLKNINRDFDSAISSLDKASRISRENHERRKNAQAPASKPVAPQPPTYLNVTGKDFVRRPVVKKGTQKKGRKRG